MPATAQVLLMGTMIQKQYCGFYNTSIYLPYQLISADVCRRLSGGEQSEQQALQLFGDMKKMSMELDVPWPHERVDGDLHGFTMI